MRAERRFGYGKASIILADTIGMTGEKCGWIMAEMKISEGRSDWRINVRRLKKASLTFEKAKEI